MEFPTVPQIAVIFITLIFSTSSAGWTSQIVCMLHSVFPWRTWSVPICLRWAGWTLPAARTQTNPLVIGFFPLSICDLLNASSIFTLVREPVREDGASKYIYVSKSGWYLQLKFGTVYIGPLNHRNEDRINKIF